MVIVSFTACKTNRKNEVDKMKSTIHNKKENYPKVINEVFKKHGGIEAWKRARTLKFNVKGQEHTTDVQSRRAVIHGENFSLGYDGKQVWLHQKDSLAFNGNPAFYYNLYFYFYAMPFVLGDDGIVYKEIEPLTFEGISYPGIKISFNADVGVSPDDNYFLFYHPETKQMAWLGYTVTYYSKKPSKKFNIIRYKQWEEINGLLLPKVITWYKKNDNGIPLEPAGKPTEFSSAEISEVPLTDDFFSKIAE